MSLYAYVGSAPSIRSDPAGLGAPGLGAFSPFWHILDARFSGGGIRAQADIPWTAYCYDCFLNHEAVYLVQLIQITRYDEWECDGGYQETESVWFFEAIPMAQSSIEDGLYERTDSIGDTVFPPSHGRERMVDTAVVRWYRASETKLDPPTNWNTPIHFHGTEARVGNATQHVPAFWLPFEASSSDEQETIVNTCQSAARQATSAVSAQDSHTSVYDLQRLNSVATTP